jgi:hypothetical protein
MVTLITTDAVRFVEQRMHLTVQRVTFCARVSWT